MSKTARKDQFWPKILYPCSNVQMCKRYTTSSFNPLFCYVLELHKAQVPQVLVYMK